MIRAAALCKIIVRTTARPGLRRGAKTLSGLRQGQGRGAAQNIVRTTARPRPEERDFSESVSAAGKAAAPAASAGAAAASSIIAL